MRATGDGAGKDILPCSPRPGVRILACLAIPWPIPDPLPRAHDDPAAVPPAAGSVCPPSCRTSAAAGAPPGHRPAALPVP